MPAALHSARPAADSPAALAQVLAMVMATHSEIDASEVRMLEAMDAFNRIGLSEPAFLKIAGECRSGTCHDLARHEWLHGDDLEAIDQILDQVQDTHHRLLLCRLAGCLITADGHVREVERSLYDHMLLRWGYTRSSVSRAMIAARVH